MLPFLKQKDQKQSAGLIVKERSPDEKPETSQDDMDHSAAIEACARALINAIHGRDSKGVAEALQDAFEILDAMPARDEESVEPHSYDAQNQAAD